MSNPAKIGADDFLMAHGVEAFRALPRVPFQTGLVWPSWVMAGAAGSFAQTYMQYLETPAAFLFMAFLTLLGHILSHMISLQSELLPQPRLYTIILGESADDRKSTAINVTTRFFQDVIEKSYLNLIFGVGSAEGLAKAFKDKFPAILILDELKSLVQKCRIDGSVLLPCINTLFESTRFHSLTKSHDITIDNAQLCLLSASTIDTYQNMFSSQFLDIGFINRLFIVVGSSERKFSIPDPIPNSAKESLRQELKEVLTFVGELAAGGCYAMPLTSRGRRIFDEWYFGQERSVFTKRLDAYGHRLLPLMAANERKAEVDADIASKVVALLNYQLEARRQADPIDADNAIAKTEERIRRTIGAGAISKRDLERRGHKNRVGSWVWTSAVANLIRGNEIYFERKTNIYTLKS
jgi:hypothetical protein